MRGMKVAVRIKKYSRNTIEIDLTSFGEIEGRFYFAAGVFQLP